jgi:hypothetical protein
VPMKANCGDPSPEHGIAAKAFIRQVKPH